MFLEKIPISILKEVAFVFLKLGILGFGGPAAHIAMMKEEVVEHRKWLSEEKFLDLIGATNLIPGPNSTEMAIHLGHLRAGWLGLLVAGVCFILPAAIIVLFIAWLYIRFGKLIEATGLLYGVKPVIIAVVLQALWGLGRTAIKTRLLAFFGLISLVCAFISINELLILFGAGFLALIFHWAKNFNHKKLSFLNLTTSLFILPALRVTETTTTSFELWPLFLFFLKVGSVLFGSGYVLLAFLRNDLVIAKGWLTETQLIDAITVGQITPGPVFTTATFIGYVLGGFWGGVVATVGIFLPAFIFVAISSFLIPYLRKSPAAGAFLDAINVASLALMAAVTWQLGKATIIDLTTVLLCLASAILLIRFRINSAWLVLGGAIIGLVLI
jgi:chromate transporter